MVSIVWFSFVVFITVLILSFFNTVSNINIRNDSSFALIKVVNTILLFRTTFSLELLHVMNFLYQKLIPGFAIIFILFPFASTVLVCWVGSVIRGLFMQKRVPLFRILFFFVASKWIIMVLIFLMTWIIVNHVNLKMETWWLAILIILLKNLDVTVSL